MEVEIPEDLANKIADWIGVYGCCKQETEEGTKPELCKYDPEKPFCCRVAFCNDMVDRIRNSVENEKICNAIVKK
jgi:hypothetical protein